MLEKPTNYGDEVFLNPKAKSIIEAAVAVYVEAAGDVDYGALYDIHLS